MSFIKLALHIRILACTLTFIFTNLAISIPQVRAQSGIVKFLKSIFSPAPPDAPKSLARGAGGRGRCPTTGIPLTAIVPTKNQYTGGLTLEEHPILWFYVPYYSSKELSSAKLVLLDAEKNIVFQKKVRLPDTPGIIKLRLPYELAINKTYIWYFSIICDLQKPTRNPSVKGWIQRVEPTRDLIQQLERIDQQKDDLTKQQQKYLAYIQNNIWYETLTNLAESRRNDPLERTFHDDWDALLNALDMPELAQEPIVNCCTLEEKEEK
jgi:hypothetical protein